LSGDGTGKGVVDHSYHGVVGVGIILSPCHGDALKDVGVKIVKGKHRIVYFDALVE
jgi:hypothetical protein